MSSPLALGFFCRFHDSFFVEHECVGYMVDFGSAVKGSVLAPSAHSTVHLPQAGAARRSRRFQNPHPLGTSCRLHYVAFTYFMSDEPFELFARVVWK